MTLTRIKSKKEQFQYINCWNNIKSLDASGPLASISRTDGSYMLRTMMAYNFPENNENFVWVKCFGGDAVVALDEKGIPL